MDILSSFLQHERRPILYDLLSIFLKELFVVHLLFSLSWNVSPSFGSKNWDGLGSAGSGVPSADILLRLINLCKIMTVSRL